MTPTEARKLTPGTVLMGRSGFGARPRIIVDHVVVETPHKVWVHEASGAHWRAADVHLPTPEVEGRWAKEVLEKVERDAEALERQEVIEFFGVQPFTQYSGFKMIDYTVQLNREQAVALMRKYATAGAP